MQVQESTPPASLVFDYSFDFLKLDPPTVDWSNVRGGQAPDTGRWNFSDQQNVIFRVLAHYLLPCNFQISSQDSSGQEAEVEAELEKVASSLGLSAELLDDVVQSFGGNTAAALRHLKSAQHERKKRLRSESDQAALLTLIPTNSDSDAISFDHHTDSSQIDAVDWLLEDFALKYGVPVTYRKLTELLELVSAFEVSVPFFMRLKTTLAMVNANADSLLPAEERMRRAIHEHIASALLRCFRNYQAAFDHQSPDCSALVQLAIALLKKTTPDDFPAVGRLPGQSWEADLLRALAQSPMWLMHAMVVKGGKPLGTLSAGGQHWAPPLEALSAEKLTRICEAVQQDVELNDTEYRFLFDNPEASIVEQSVKHYATCIWELAGVFMDAARTDKALLRSESSMQLYLAVNNLIIFMREVSPASEQILAAMNAGVLFRPMLMSQIEQECARAELWVSRMIETETWELQETLRDPSSPETDKCYHSVSAHDLVFMLVQTVHPLMSRWKLPDVASLVRRVMWYYCSKMEEMCRAELEELIAGHGREEFSPQPQEQSHVGRLRSKTIAVVSSKVRKKKSATTVLQPPDQWWAKLSNIHYLIDRGTMAFIEGLEAIDDIGMGDEEIEVFEEAVLVCREPCVHNLDTPLNQVVDLHAETMSTIICDTLAGTPAVDPEAWWDGLIGFLDEVLDQPAEITTELLFLRLLKRCGDGFSRAFEAVLVGDTQVHGVSSLSTKLDLLQHCLQDVSEFFHAGGQGLSDHMLDRNMSIHSRLGALVSYHAFDNMMLMGHVQALSGHKLNEQESVNRGLALLVLSSRSHDDSEVQQFLADEDQAERAHSEEAHRASRQRAAPDVKQLSLLWGTQCDLEQSIAEARGEASLSKKSSPAGFLAAAQQADERHVLPCLQAYLEEGDPLVKAANIAKASESTTVPEEHVRHAAYVAMLSAIISSSLRPREGKHIVSKNATVREGKEVTSKQVGKLMRGDVINVLGVHEQSDGTVRVSFDDGQEEGLRWVTGTKSDGQVLLQRVPPGNLTKDNCVLLKRALLSARMLSKRQRTLSSAAMTVGTPGTPMAEATPTPRVLSNHTTSELAETLQLDAPVGAIWYLNVADHAARPDDRWAPFTYTECQKLERAYIGEFKATKLDGGTVKFRRDGEMVYVTKTGGMEAKHAKFDADAWRKLEVQHSGHLDKKGARDMDGFKTRWFELREHRLVYFDAEKQSIKGDVNLFNAARVEDAEDENELQIVMGDASSRTYRLLAPSADDKDAWVAALSAAREQALLEQETTQEHAIKRCKFIIPGMPTADAPQSDWLQQNLFMQAILASARRVQHLEEQLHRLGQDQDPLYLKGAFPEGVYDLWKAEEMCRVEDQMSRLKARTQNFPFCGRLAVRLHGAAYLKPKGGWPRDAHLCCRVEIHDREGETQMLESRAKQVDRQTGNISWQDEEFPFTLTSEPMGVSLSVFSVPPANAAKGQGGRRRSVTMVTRVARPAGELLERQLVASVALDLHQQMAWCPYPHWRDIEVGVPCTNWQSVGSFPQNTSIAVLRLGLQYSFTRVNNSATRFSEESVLAETAAGQLLDVAVAGLLAAVNPREAGEREAVRWLVEEYGGMTGLTDATRAATRLHRLMPYVAVETLWLDDAAQAIEALTASQSVLLDAERRLVEPYIDQLYDMVLTLFTTFDISFPAGTFVFLPSS